MSAVSTEFTVERVLELVSVMPTPDQWSIAESILRTLKKSSKAGKTTKAKKERDPDAPKREPSDWIKHTTHVRQFLADEHKGVPCTQSASMLKEEGKMFADEADVMDAYARWQENPPVKADKADKKVSKASSVADESGAEDVEKPKKQRKPRAKMTDEQKAAAKAKREAKKAAAEESDESDAESVVAPVAAAPKPVAKPVAKPVMAAESDESDAESVVAKPVVKAVPKPVVKAVATPAEKPKTAKVMKPVVKAAEKPKPEAPKPEAPKPVVAQVTQEGEFWEHNFGSGVDKYERFPGDAPNTYYVFHPTDGYMGLWNETDQELDPDVADPTA